MWYKKLLLALLSVGALCVADSFVAPPKKPRGKKMSKAKLKEEAARSLAHNLSQATELVSLLADLQRCSLDGTLCIVEDDKQSWFAKASAADLQCYCDELEAVTSMLDSARMHLKKHVGFLKSKRA